MPINKEKQEIIDIQGNVLVTANPGTGKTLLLAYKYIDLIRKNIDPEQILCLTFTEKAKKEMEKRILEVSEEEKVGFDASKLNVFTFHSYSLYNIDENDILSTNLLRYTILRYLKEKEILNYSDDYLIEKIVPKMENLMRYLKSFGITPEKVDINNAKKFLEEQKSYSKEEIDKFAEYFIDIFSHYEKIKNRRGVDYADLLINFLRLREIPVFDYVLVDELQDVNIMEADIAIKSGKNFFAVGDKKQAIFGFQGGSILNFRKFENSTQKVLSENFRSTDEILDYAREYFVAKTKEQSHREELRDLHSAKNKKGSKPYIYDIARNNIYAAACELAKGLKGKTAIIARTNFQIMELSRELSARNIDFSSTFFSASEDARNYIISFLKGVLSRNINDVKNSMFTPFFPCTIQDAFELSSEKDIEKIFERVPAFKDIREKVKNVEDVNFLFEERIIPVCVGYGKEYVFAAVSMQKAYQEAISFLEDKSMDSLVSFLQSTDLLSNESEAEKDIVLTTVHKAKGRQYDNVIYIPSKTRDNSNFQDNVVEGILKSENINVEEELDEETLRINFVAFTRAKEKLVILTDKVNDYLNDYAELKNIDVEEDVCLELDEAKKKAFTLFINKRFDEAKELLDSKNNWIKGFVEEHFKGMEHISFSALPSKAYEYLVNRILNIRKVSYATNLGSEVHHAASQIILGKEYPASDEAKPFVENARKVIDEIKKDYPEVVGVEMRFEPMLKDLGGFDCSLRFQSYIDAVFKNNDEYLIVDWKTDKKESNAYKHRQQLEAYKRVFSAKEGVALDKIKAAIGFIGLRGTINTDVVGFKLDMKQPGNSSFNTFSRKVNLLLSWIEDSDRFFRVLMDEKADDMLWRSVVEEYQKE
jgi:DNA helicase-2/ATP-dependent DNA helicase PcrA